MCFKLKHINNMYENFDDYLESMRCDEDDFENEEEVMNDYFENKYNLNRD